MAGLKNARQTASQSLLASLRCGPWCATSCEDVQDDMRVALPVVKMKGRWPQIQWRSRNLPEFLEKQERKPGEQEQPAIPSSRRTSQGPGGLLRSPSPIRPCITEASKPGVTDDIETLCGIESEHCNCMREQGGSLSDRMRDPDFIYRLGDADPDLSFVARIDSPSARWTRDNPSMCSTRTAETDVMEPNMSDVGLEGMLPKQEPKAEPALDLQMPPEEDELPEPPPQTSEEMKVTEAKTAAAPEPEPELPSPQPGIVIVSMLREDSEELRKEEEMLRLQEEVLKGQKEDEEHLTSQRAKPEGFGQLGHFVEQKNLEPEQDQPVPEVSVKEPVSSNSSRQFLAPPLPTLKETTAENNTPCPPSPPPGILSPRSGGGLLQVPDALPRSATNSSIGSGSKKSVSFSLVEDPNPKKKYNYRAAKAKQERPTSERDGVMWHLLPG